MEHLDTPDSSNPWKKILFWSAAIIIFILVLSAVLIHLTPSIISSPWGTKQVEAIINKRIDGNLSIGKIKASWNHGVTFSDVSFKNNSESIVVSCPKISASTPILRLLRGGKQLGDIVINEPQIVIDAKAHVPTKSYENIETATGLKPQHVDNTKLTETLQQYAAHLTIKNGNTTFTAPTLSDVKLSYINIDATINPAEKVIQFRFNTNSEQATQSGSIALNTSLTGTTIPILYQQFISRSPDVIIPEDAAFSFNLNIFNFPTIAIKQVVELCDQELPPMAATLLGQQCDLKINYSTTLNNGHINIATNTSNIVGEINGSIKDGIFSLEYPVDIKLDIAPTVLKEWNNKNGKFILLSASPQATASLHLQSLSLPINFSLPDFSHLAVQGSFKLDEFSAAIADATAPIKVQNTSGKISTLVNTKEYSCDLSTTLSYQDVNTPITIAATMKDIFSSHGAIQWNDANINSQIRIKQFPTKVVSYLLDNEVELDKFIGPEINILSEINIIEGHINTNNTFYSDNIEAQNIPLSISEAMTLMNPITVKYTLPAEAINPYLLPIQDLQIEQDLQVTAEVNKFFIDLGILKNYGFTPKTVVFDGSINIPKIPLNKLPWLDKGASPTRVKTNIAVKGSSLDDLEISSKTKIEQTTPSTAIEMFSGTPTNINARCTLSVKPSGDIDVKTCTLYLDSPKITAAISGELNADHQLTLLSPAHFKWSVTPQFLSFYNISSFLPITHTSIPMELTINASNIPIKDKDISKLQATGLLMARQLDIVDKMNNSIGSINDPSIKFDLDATKNLLKLLFTSETVTPHQALPGTVKTSVDITNLLDKNNIALNKAVIDIQTQCKNLPLIAYDALLYGSTRFASIIGEVLNADISAKLKPPYLGEVDLSINADFLQGKIKAISDGTNIAIEQLSSINWTVTPQSYLIINKLLQNNNITEDISLMHPMNIVANINSCKVPYTVDKEDVVIPTFHLSDAAMDVEFVIPVLPLHNIHNKEATTLQNTDIKFSSPSLTKEITFSAESELASAESQDTKNQQKALFLQGTIKDLLTKDGTINQNLLSANITTTTHRLPVNMLAHFFSITGTPNYKLLVLLGDNFSARSQLIVDDMQGNFNINFTASNSNASIDTRIEDSALTLNENMSAEIFITPHLGKLWLHNVNPILASCAYSDTPIKLFVNNQGTYVPLAPWDLKKIEVPHATLDCHKLILENNGLLPLIIRFFKMDPASKGSQVSAWFTPTDLSIKDGIASYGRTDILLDEAFHIATWGQINLITKELDMILGIPADSLQGFLNVDKIDKDFVLTIPMTGTIDNIHVDWRRAATQVASLIAIGQNNPRHDMTAIFLNSVSKGLMDSKAKIPPPKLPFPWSTETKAPKEQQKEQPAQQQQEEETTPASPMHTFFNMLNKTINEK